MRNRLLGYLMIDRDKGSDLLYNHVICNSERQLLFLTTSSSCKLTEAIASA